MPSFRWQERHTKEQSGTGAAKTTVWVSRRAIDPSKKETLDLGSPILSPSSLLAGMHVVIHDLGKGMIEKLKIVDGKVTDGPDPRAEWSHLGNVKLIKIERENGNVEQYSLYSMGVLPYRHSNQRSTNTMTFLSSPEFSVPI